MRSQRSYMVQTTEQYQFVYSALTEHTLFGNTEFEIEEIDNILDEGVRELPGGVNGFSHQFKKLDLLPANTDQIRSASHPMNLRKNRMMSVRPYDSNRVVLPFKLDANKCIIEQTDYINASRIGK